MKSVHYGKLGVISGFMALGIALFHFWLGPFSHASMTLEEIAVEKAAEIKKSFSVAMEGESRAAKKANPDLNIDKLVKVTGIALAFLSLVLAAVSFLLKEDYRYSVISATLGSVTLAFHFILVAISIGILLVLIAIIISNLK